MNRLGTKYFEESGSGLYTMIFVGLGIRICHHGDHVNE